MRVRQRNQVSREKKRHDPGEAGAHRAPERAADLPCPVSPQPKKPRFEQIKEKIAVEEIMGPGLPPIRQIEIVREPYDEHCRDGGPEGRPMRQGISRQTTK